jgi:hypothetical protein
MNNFEIELYRRKKRWKYNINIRENKKWRCISFNRSPNIKNTLKTLTRDLNKMKEDKQWVI